MSTNEQKTGKCICCDAPTLYPDETLCVPCADEVPADAYGYQDDDVGETAAELTGRK